MNVSEIFHSVQGEGRTIGTPAVFLRLTGCNLLCGAPKAPRSEVNKMSQEEIYEIQGDDASWTCDTISVWTKGTAIEPEMLAHNLFTIYGSHFLSGSHLVITGGEPLLQQDILPALISSLRAKLKYDVFVEVETNGTVIPSLPVVKQVNLFNVSPKLANSGMPKTRRIIPEAMKIFSGLAVDGKAIFKFVVNNRDHIFEAQFDYVKEFNLPQSSIYLMPGCSNIEQFNEFAPIIAEESKQFGYKLSPRLQINIWNETTGV